MNPKIVPLPRRPRGMDMMDWIGLAIGLGMLSFTLISYAHSVFENKDQAKERADWYSKRFDRIDEKLDHLIQNANTRRGR